MVNILKRHLDQALQGGKGAQGLEIFCKLLKSKTQHQNSKPKTQPLSKTLKCKKKLFQPRANLLQLKCHVLCGGERQQVPGKWSIKENAEFGRLSNIIF